MTHEVENTLAEPCAFVVFGGNGDLTQRLLFPALIDLAKQNRLPDNFILLGVARSIMSKDAYTELLWKNTESVEPQVRNWFAERTYYLGLDLAEEKAYPRLKETLSALMAKHQIAGNAVFYCATAPTLFATVAEGVSQVGLTTQDRGWRRIVIEKPFGRDLASAQALDNKLKALLHENQIYRIDHYLGKETVQNILAFRLANSIFEPLWNHRYIDSVQISTTERLGVEKRAGYYDKSGALRDMVPNHLFQLLTLIAMEPPVSFKPEDVRDRKVDVLKSVVPLTKDSVQANVVRAQYGSASRSDTLATKGYSEELGVTAASQTETFVAMKLRIDNWRWSGVPFFLRTGKRLSERATEVHIQFKRPPIQLFHGAGVNEVTSNVLTFKIQPDESIILNFETKIPGLEMKLAPTSLEFDYEKRFGRSLKTGYETLLFDVMTGDTTLFQRSDQIEYGWRIVQPILDFWLETKSAANIEKYDSYSEGPKSAIELLARDGRKWLKCNR